jgi:Flp pilus assembly protein CpaB
MTYRVRNLVIAIGLALVAMMLTLFYVTNYKRSVQHGESQVQVWVAARDVQTGTSGAELVKKHAFKSVQVPKRSVVAGAISDPEQVSRLVASQPLYTGEQVTVRRFQSSKSQGIVGQIKATGRAVSVPGKPDQLLAGILKTGDHVDVVGSIKPAGSDGTRVTRIVLRDILVLQAPATPTTAKVDPQNTIVSAILNVTDTQVQRLFYLMTAPDTDWTLELRPVIDSQDSSERLDGWVTVLTEGIGAKQWQHFVDGNFKEIANGQ